MDFRCNLHLKVRYFCISLKLLSLKCVCFSPELHFAIHQRQGQEVGLVVVAVVQQHARHLRGPELHGDAYGVVCPHGGERQVRLASEGRDVVFDNYSRGRERERERT